MSDTAPRRHYTNEDKRSVAIGLTFVLMVAVVVLHFAGVYNVNGINMSPGDAGPLGIYWAADLILGHPWLSVVAGFIAICTLTAIDSANTAPE
jgi:hypothetical protein